MSKIDSQLYAAFSQVEYPLRQKQQQTVNGFVNRALDYIADDVASRHVFVVDLIRRNITSADLGDHC